jgi:hypothetical protein
MHAPSDALPYKYNFVLQDRISDQVAYTRTAGIPIPTAPCAIARENGQSPADSNIFHSGAAYHCIIRIISEFAIHHFLYCAIRPPWSIQMNHKETRRYGDYGGDEETGSTVFAMLHPAGVR